MTSSTSSPADSALPALERALDPEAMHETLVRATGSGAAKAYTVRILSHKARQRCTVRYDPVDASGRAVAEAGAVIGKLYRSRRRAARMYRRQVALGASAFPETSRTRLPAALLFAEELGLVLQACVDGVDLRNFLAEGSNTTPLELAGRWLARLHACEPLDEVKFASAAGRLARLEGWAADVAPVLSEGERQLWARALERAGPALASPEAASRPTLVHKDFYYANLLWDGERIWGLDLDELSLGDPAFDVAHFVAHLERQTWRTGLGLEAAARPASVFLRAYEKQGGAGARPTMPFYRSYTFTKLAATEVERRREDWRRAACTLAERGRQELESFVGP